MKRLISSQKIIYDNRPPLRMYMYHFLDTLDRNVLELETKKGTIKIIFLKRHIPHLLGLHHFLDKSSHNKTLWYIDQLSGSRGFKNMLSGKITWSDLEHANDGNTWNSKKNKRRALSIHLLRLLLFKSSVYVIDGVLKNSVKGKYLMVCEHNSIKYNIVIEEDIDFNRYDTYYFCLSNLIDDPAAKKIINDPHTKQVDCLSFSYKDFDSDDLLEYRSGNFVFDINSSFVVTKQYPYPMIKYLISKNCSFYAIYNPSNGMYQLSFCSFDNSTIKAIQSYY